MTPLEKDELIRVAANEVLDLISDRHEHMNWSPQREGFDTYFDAEPMEDEAAEIIRKTIGKIIAAQEKPPAVSSEGKQP